MSFPWKRPIKESIFGKVAEGFWQQNIEQTYRTYVLTQDFWAMVPLAAVGTFHSLNFLWIWFQILHAMIQSLKESWIVTMELIFSIELVEAITCKCSKKSGSENTGGTYKKTLISKCECRLYRIHLCQNSRRNWA